MKVTLNHVFETASGKLCKNSSTYVSCNQQTGKMYTAEWHGANQPNTEAQQQVKKVFTDKTKAASAWWAANRPTEQNPSGTADYQQLMKQYKAQRKIGNPYSYLRSLVQDDLTILLGGKPVDISTAPGGDTTTDTGGSNPPSME